MQLLLLTKCTGESEWLNTAIILCIVTIAATDVRRVDVFKCLTSFIGKGIQLLVKFVLSEKTFSARE